MNFRKFWASYLRTHRVPGARALRYFSIAFAIMVGVEALLAQQPLIFFIGIAICYGIATTSHWLLERNQSLSLVDPVWSATADLYMLWLAVTGRLHREYVAHGLRRSKDAPMTSPNATPHSAKGLSFTKRYVLGGFRAYSMRALLVLSSAAGLVAGVIDLQDLSEPGLKLHFPVLQLGVPILAFAGALTSALLAFFAARQDRLLPLGGAGSLSGKPVDIKVVHISQNFSDREKSLRSASLALFAIGVTTLVLAELAESASPEPAFLWIWGFVLAAMLCALLAVVLPLFKEVRRAETTYAGTVDRGNTTRGIRVDRTLPFWSLLACPACGGGLFARSRGVGCSECQTDFLSEDESAQIDLRLRVPKIHSKTFIVGEASELPIGIVTDEIPANARPAIPGWADVKIPANLTAGNRLTPELLSYFPKPDESGKWMLDLGCGSSERAFFEQLTNLKYLGVDWTGQTADLLADAHSLPFQDKSFELVVCLAVLEHVRMPDIVVSEALRVLRPGGVLVGTSAFLEPFHLNSYEHMTHLAIYRALRGAGFEVILIAPNRQWSGLRAMAEMSLFPLGPLPRWLKRISVAPIEVASRGAWALKRLKGGKRASELRRLLETTGGFRFVARRPI